MSESKQATKDRLLATVAMLTGDKVLAPYGELMLKQSTNRPRKNSIGSGFILDSETGAVARDPGYAEYEQGRDRLEAEQRSKLQSDMMDRLGYSADLRTRQPRYTSQETEGGVAPVQINPNARGGARAEPTIPLQRPISDADRQKAAEAGRLAQEARSLFSELEKTPGTVSSPKDIAAEAIGKVPIVGRGASRAYTEESFTPEQLSIKSRGDRYEQNLSNLAAGLSLTGYELEQRDRWSPFARGISQNEAMRRLTNIERDFGDRQSTIMKANDLSQATFYGRGSPEDTEARQRSRTAHPQQRVPKRVRVDQEGNIIGN